MGIDRLRPTQRPDHRQLAEGVVQMVVAANDMGDPHVMIIDHDGEHIGRRSVGAQQHHVIKLGILHRHITLHRIVDGNGTALRCL